jgi:micrococcal nuclease
MSTFLIALALYLVAHLVYVNAQAAEQRSIIQPGQFRVVDGDTIRIGKHDVRAYGYDTPEKGSLAKCDLEREMAARATARMKELISPPHVFTAKYVKGRDKYGRPLARFYSDHQDVAAILIAEGLAHPYKGGKKQAWCYQ